MPTPVACSHCGKSVRLPDNWTQPGFKCPACQQVTRLPIPKPPPPPTPAAPAPAALDLAPAPEQQPQPRGELVPYDEDDRPRRRRREPEHQVVEHHSYDHTPKRSAFGTAFGVSTGCLLGVLAVLAAGFIGMAVLCAGCLGFLGETARRVDEQRKQEEERNAPVVETKDGGAVKATPGSGIGAGVGEWSKIGDVRLRIDRVAVQFPIYVDRDFRGKETEFEGKEKQLVVWFTVENLSKTKRLEYSRWDTLVFGDPAVRLTDEHGNKYTYHPPLGLRGYLKGGLTTSSKVVNPGEPPITDAVTFDRPVSAATELRLSAKTPVIGTTAGRHEFRIPASAWR